MSQCRTQKRWGCFCTVPFFFCAFTQSREKAFNTLREALKERCWPRLKLKYVPGGWELRLDLFFYFHFLRGFCSNFPAISLCLGVGNCQCGFSGKLIRVHAIVHTWPFQRKCQHITGNGCVCEWVCKSNILQILTHKFTPDVRDLSRNLEFM